MPTENFNKLLDLYDAITDDNLLETFTSVLKVTNSDYHTAYRKAGTVIHTQGRIRSIMTESKMNELAADSEENGFEDEIITSELKSLLNRYIGYIQDQDKNDEKVRALIVYLIIKQLGNIILELSFNEYYKDVISKLLLKTMELKESLIEDVIMYLDSVGKPAHAEVVKSAGWAFLEINPFQAINKYITPLKKKKKNVNSLLLSESLDDQDREFIVNKRKEYLDIIVSPKVHTYFSLIGIKTPRVGHYRIVAIKNDLHTMANSIEMQHLSEFIFNNPV